MIITIKKPRFQNRWHFVRLKLNNDELTTELCDDRSVTFVFA